MTKKCRKKLAHLFQILDKTGYFSVSNFYTLLGLLAQSPITLYYTTCLDQPNTYIGWESIYLERIWQGYGFLMLNFLSLGYLEA